MAHTGATWLAIWAGIFSAVSVIINGGYIIHPSAQVLGTTGWLSIIATILAWIAAGAIYNSGRRNTSGPYKPAASATIVPSRPPAKYGEPKV